MCNCGKRKVSIPDSGPGFGGGARGLPTHRAVPSTVAPMPRVVYNVRRATVSVKPAPISMETMTEIHTSSTETMTDIPKSVHISTGTMTDIPIPPPPTPRGVRHPVEGIDPVVWGPHAWYILHTLAELVYRSPEGERLDGHWASLVVSTAESIPCPTCARHFRTWMKWVPFESSVNATIVRVRFAELHNMVNRTKKSPTWSGDLATIYTGSATELRERIASMRGIIGDPMLNAATTMLDILE